MLQQFPFQETHRKSGFLLNPMGREQITIRHLVLTVLEVLGLDPALVDQRTQAVVDLAQAHAELFGELALRDLWILLDQLDDLVGDFFGHMLATVVGTLIKLNPGTFIHRDRQDEQDEGLQAKAHKLCLWFKAKNQFLRAFGLGLYPVYPAHPC